MSILTFLLFTSFLYFAVADPIAVTSSKSSDQEGIDKFMEVIGNGFDEHFAPILVDLSKDDLSYLKITTLDGVGSFLNYCYIRAKQQTNSESNGKAVDDFIVMNLNPAENFPAVACQQPSSCEEGEQEPSE